MKLKKFIINLKYDLKCAIGWHAPRVTGWTEEDDPDELDDPRFNTTVEMSYECVNCDHKFWDYLYKGKPLDTSKFYPIEFE